LNIGQEIADAASLITIYGPTDILLNLSLAFALGVVVSSVYKYTHRGLSYSQSFMVTLVIISVTVAMVMMIIGNNLARAFALVGALSIIRFRTVVKDTKDMGYVFIVLAAGMASGTSSYFLAIAGSLFLTVIAFVLHITNYGSLYKSEFILRFRSAVSDGEPIYNPVLDELTKSTKLLHIEPSADGATSKLTFDVMLKKDIEPELLSQQLGALDNISEVMLIASKNDADY
jgi:uncharacterized membrane protein YhiD involved in acid resistance